MAELDPEETSVEEQSDVYFLDADGEFEPAAEQDEEASWLARLSANVASTAKAVRDIPANLRRDRPSQNHIRSELATVPLGARQVSHGYADDLWQARPTLDRPYPVVLLHGTISSKNVWQNLVLRLRNDGFVVFSPDYGMHGTQDIPTSAQDVGAYIEQVLAATGAPAVDIVAHSQGGLLARLWINELGGEDYVHHLITLGATHHGTTPFGMLGSVMSKDTALKLASGTIRRVFGEAGLQQIAGSPLLETLAASPDTRPEILYTCFASRNDTTVVPHERAFLSPTEDDPHAEPPTETEDSSPIADEDYTGPVSIPAPFQPDSEFSWVRNFFLQDLGITTVLHEFLPSNPDVHNIVHSALLWGLRELPDGEE